MNAKWGFGHLKFPKVWSTWGWVCKWHVQSTYKVMWPWRKRGAWINVEADEIFNSRTATNVAANAIWSGWMLFILPPPKRLKCWGRRTALASWRVRIRTCKDVLATLRLAHVTAGAFFPPWPWIPIYSVCFTETGFSASINFRGQSTRWLFGLWSLKIPALWCLVTAWGALSSSRISVNE